MHYQRARRGANMDAPPVQKGSGVCGKCGAPKVTGADCKPCHNAANKKYKAAHAEEIKLARAKYKKEKWERGAEFRKASRLAKKATKQLRRRSSQQKWKQQNKGAVNSSTVRRFAAKLRATPSWANAFYIEEAYILAAKRTELTGIDWHVDHIVPLRSKKVCGLHVESNLRVIPAIQNMRKNNKYWADMATA